MQRRDPKDPTAFLSSLADNGPTNVADWLPDDYEAPEVETPPIAELEAKPELSAADIEGYKRIDAALLELKEKEAAAREKNPATFGKAGAVERFETVEAYFKDGNPKPLSHRLGEPNYERRVSDKTKRLVKKRDGNCCLVCGSTRQLEVDHRIALMNGGDNSVDNLGTLCDDCHNKKTRYDYSIRKRRKKEVSRR